MTSGQPVGGAQLRQHVTDAVLSAALEELIETGYERLSMDRVAKRAGVGKAAIYRRWAGKQALVIDALADLRELLPDPPNESIEAMVWGLVTGIDLWLAEPRVAVVVPDIYAQAQRYPELVAGMQEQLFLRRAEVARRALSQWTTPDDAGQRTRDFALDLITGPVYWRVSQQLPIDEPYLRRLTDVVVDMLKRADPDWESGPRQIADPL